jgi:hypothetical protein
MPGTPTTLTRLAVSDQQDALALAARAEDGEQRLRRRRLLLACAPAVRLLARGAEALQLRGGRLLSGQREVGRL